MGDAYFWYWAIRSNQCSKFQIFSGMDLSNVKSLMINPLSHSAHYFCHLHEYSAHKVQASRGITLRNYKKNSNCIYLCSIICQIGRLVDLRLEVGISGVRGEERRSPSISPLTRGNYVSGTSRSRACHRCESWDTEQKNASTNSFF